MKGGIATSRLPHDIMWYLLQSLKNSESMGRFDSLDNALDQKFDRDIKTPSCTVILIFKRQEKEKNIIFYVELRELRNGMPTRPIQEKKRNKLIAMRRLETISALLMVHSECSERIQGMSPTPERSSSSSVFVVEDTFLSLGFQLWLKVFKFFWFAVRFLNCS
ncbi:hypothetical protein RCL_jg10589.t1 [Rhizophagus clarus]|uniref:Uncharacterized protein n=1 Tax=Rhizophagus clarus TaxID=94130 RepID=A0A8H3L8Z8_9GLOM|nr:hypothetical protein RCL_jg10589.t1 [Rhizophagus clarus]